MKAMVPDPRLGRNPAADAGVDGQLAYAIGDIHGCYALMRDLLARIAGDAVATARGRRPIVVLLGDLIDRGPDSAQVVEAAVWLKQHDAVEFHLLMGNHERAMLDFVESPDADAWLSFGGDATLRSYGVEPPDDDAPIAQLIKARDQLLGRMPAAHLHCLQHGSSMVTLGDYVFVHAGIRPGIPLHKQSDDALLWIGSEFTDSAARHEKIVVHGHSIEEDACILPNRIGIDTGAYRSGVLTALRIEDGVQRLIQSRLEANRAAA